MHTPHQRRSRVHPRHIPISETIEAWLFLIGILVSVWIIQSGIVGATIGAFGNLQELAAFFVGFFYTSVLTTAPAIAAFTELSSELVLWKIAVFGSVGAVVGEVFMFRFVRSPLMEHLMNAVFHPITRRLGRSAIAGSLWWVAPVGGLLVIGSPLPDELGLLMLGLSHLRLMQFIPLAFAANVIGIYAIAFFGHLLG